MRTPRRPAHVVAAAAVAGTLGAGAAVALAAGSAGDLDPSFGSGGIQQVRGLDDSNDVALAIQPDGKLVTGGRTRALRFTADGQPDQSFGVGGIVPIPDETPTDLKNASGVAVDAEGRTLIAGSFQPGGGVSDRTALLRLLPDGSPDPSFGGTDGIVDVDVTTQAFQSETGQAVLVQPDGKYLVVGTAGSDVNERPAVVRFFSNGTPDPSFAGDGSLVYGSAAMEAERAVLVGSDLYVSGYEKGASEVAPRAGVVAKVKADGTLDASFGTGGLARSPQQPGLTASDVVVLPDGRVRQLASRSAEADLTTSLGILNAFTAAGAPDPAVGSGGQRVYDLTPGAGTFLSSMTLAGDRLVVAGATNGRLAGDASSRADSVVGRLTLDGAPDPSFSGDGFATRDEGTALAIPTSLRIDGAGRPVVAGFVLTDAGGSISTRLARYLAADQPAATTAPPATVTVPGPTVTVPATTPPTPALPSAASVLKLPSPAKCVSRRTVRLTVKAPTGRTIRKLTAKVGKAKARTVKAPVTLSLKGRPKGKVKVVVTATLSDGSTLKRTVTYTLCAKKKAKR